MNDTDLIALTSSHPAMRCFFRRGDELTLAGRGINDWIQEANATPAYLYDSSIIQNQVVRLRADLPSGIRISYAIKANPFEPLVRRIGEWVDGFDVASLQEMELALRQDMRFDQISFAGPGKSMVALRRAIEAGVIINLESANEMKRCLELGNELGVRPRVCIRVNPGLDVRASGMKMSSSEGSPFGIDYAEVPDILENFPVDQLELLGLHVYGCSQQLDAERLLNYLAAVLEQLKVLESRFPVPVRQINLGGGFGIPYFPNDQQLDLKAVGSGLGQLLAEHQKWLDGIDIKMEFGRFLVGEAGIYVCRVQDIKQSAGKTYVIVDGGMHHHLANAGLLGQVVRRNFPVAVANKMNHMPVKKVNVCGPLCTPLDRVASEVELPALEIDDLLAVFSSGAYGLTASPQGFLSQPAALEILCE